MAEFAIVLTTVPDGGLGETLARTLVDGRLAACVNVLPPMTSFYRWQGAIEQGSECQLIVKTTSANVAAVMAAIRSRHPYENPELLVIPVASGGSAYLDWIRQSTTAVDGSSL